LTRPSPFHNEVFLKNREFQQCISPPDSLDLVFNLGLDLCGHLVTQLLDLFSVVVHQTLSAVLCFNSITARFVLSSKLVSLVHHAVNFVLQAGSGTATANQFINC